MSIPFSQLLQMSVASYANAEDLLKDAEVLFAAERWARTLFLCQIAAEEMAKSLLSLWAAVRVRLGEFDAAQETRYRDCLCNHKMKTATLQAIEDFFWTARSIVDLKQSVSRNEIIRRDSDIANHEKIKLSALYADLDGDGAFCPGRFFSTADKVGLDLKLAQRRMELFRANVPPLFGVMGNCDIEQCRIWMNNLGPLL